MEEWRTISGFEDYEVSNAGRVRIKESGRVLKPKKANNQSDSNCYAVRLNKDGKQYVKQIGRVVYTAFISSDLKTGDVVTHKDKNPKNNVPENLKKTTRSELIKAVKTKKKKCAICGKEFETTYKRVVTCSEKCRTENEKRNAALNWQKQKYKRDFEREKYENNRKSIADIAMRAKEMGISYGEYVSRFL